MLASQFSVRRTGDHRYLLDVRGQNCPYPQLLTMRAIQTLSTDDVLEVLLDNPPSLRDIPIALRKQGYGVTDPVRLGHGAWKIELTLSP